MCEFLICRSNVDTVSFSLDHHSSFRTLMKQIAKCANEYKIKNFQTLLVFTQNEELISIQVSPTKKNWKQVQDYSSSKVSEGDGYSIVIYDGMQLDINRI